MPRAKTLNSNETMILEDEEYPQNLFPEIINFKELLTDRNLPIVTFENFSEIVKTKKGKIDLTINLPYSRRVADIYLLVDECKKDMFYQVKPGFYNFKNVKLSRGENLIELFYRIGEKRSSSVYSIIIRE